MLQFAPLDRIHLSMFIDVHQQGLVDQLVEGSGVSRVQAGAKCRRLSGP
jgi:hypothetical protein